MIPGIKAYEWIVACESIFHDESGDRGLRVLGEEHIMSDTEPDQNVETRAGFIQQRSLKERVAGCFEFFWVSDFILRRNAQVFFLHCPT